jgi:hypothetical protein
VLLLAVEAHGCSSRESKLAEELILLRETVITTATTIVTSTSAAAAAGAAGTGSAGTATTAAAAGDAVTESEWKQCAQQCARQYAMKMSCCAHAALSLFQTTSVS